MKVAGLSKARCLKRFEPRPKSASKRFAMELRVFVKLMHCHSVSPEQGCNSVKLGKQLLRRNIPIVRLELKFHGERQA